MKMTQRSASKSRYQILTRERSKIYEAYLVVGAG